MIEGKSLDKISSQIHINKETAFDWRHKILSSIRQDTGEVMDGIVESDETFFEASEKGNKDMDRPGRKRGSSSSLSGKKKRGISANKVAVIATVDRQGGMNLCAATMGRTTMPLLSPCVTLQPGVYRFNYHYTTGIELFGTVYLSDFYVTYGKAGTAPRTWEPVKEHLDVYTPTSEGIVTDEIAVEITETGDYVFAFFLGERQFNLMLYGAAVAKSGPDMAFGKVITPITSCTTGSEEILGADVYNKGSEAASEFTLTYKIGGKPAVTQTFTQAVAVDDTVTVYFTQPADLSAVGEHSITFTVLAAGETIIDNNTAQAVVKHTEVVTEWPFESDFSSADDIADWYNGEGDPGTYGGWHVTPGTNCYFGLATTMPLLSPCVTLQSGVYRFNYHYTTGIELFGTVYTSDFYVAYGKSGTDPKTWAPAKEYDDEYVPLPAVEDGFNVIITEPGEYVFGFFITQSDGDLSIYKTSLSDNVGIEDGNLLSDAQLSLWPNPASDVLNIELCNNNTINCITVYNASGKVVYAASNINSTQFSVSTAAFDSGVYFIQVQTPHGMVNAKFVVR
jgi:hypothetical protein